MKKVFVKTMFLNDYGCPVGKANFNWFETLEQAEEYAAGLDNGWFKVLKIAEGNYEDYEKMCKIEIELEELKKIF